MFVRPCRSAAIRTRLDLETVRERLARIAQGTASPDTPITRGHVLSGTVGPDDFHLAFRFQSAKNPAKYSVRGRIQDETDWRIVRLKLTARDPGLGPVELAFLAGFVALHVWAEELPAKAGIGALMAVMVFYALVNLLYVPDLVTSRVAGAIAAEINGSIQRRDH